MLTWEELHLLPEYLQLSFLEGEFWVPIPEFEQLYKVSNYGRVKSLDRTKMQKHPNGKLIEHTYKGRLIKLDFSSNKFGSVNLYDRSRKVTYSIYHLVLDIFGQVHADSFFYGINYILSYSGEIWKDVEGYESLYQISNFGRIRKFSKNRILILSVWDSDGYNSITLSKDNSPLSFLVHRLVAQAFIPNPENKPQVNHIDGNKKNNHVENLEWVTASENMQHAYDNGLIIKTSESMKIASDIAMKKLKVPVYCKELNMTFDSLSEASKYLSIDLTKVHYASIHHNAVQGYTFERIS